ncbi:MAG: MFS transporter, partial [Dinoroseobacter sp.]|nr:MFS transporter [Dinoroseobacter sp.]
MTEPRHNLALVFLLWLAGLGAAAQYGKVSVIFDKLPQIYPEAGPVLGWAVSLVGFVGILLGVTAGVLAARIGFRRALLWALVLVGGRSLFQSSFPPLPVFLGLRLIEGVS